MMLLQPKPTYLPLNAMYILTFNIFICIHISCPMNLERSHFSENSLN